MALNEFLSKIRKNDLARSNRFEIEILKGNTRDINILCEEAQVPGMVIAPAPIKIGNITEQRAHSLDFFGDQASFTFFCDTSWNVRSYFEEWMYSTVNPQTKEISYYDDMITTVNLYALNRKDQRVKGWEFLEALPRNISTVNFSQGNEAPVRVSFLMYYKLWRPIESASIAPYDGGFANSLTT